LGKYLSLDCEMVGCGPPPPHELSQLARVSIVNYLGLPILDIFVLPVSPVTDWRTPISGVRPSDMANAIPFSTAREQVQTLLRGRILIGHALHNDLKALNLKHPRRDVRDTSQLEILRKIYGNGRTPALRRLSKEVLGVEIQGGEHSSVVDARACMLVYRRFRREFE
ncbi:ribonuclease H-like domain-containing protein, partial [Terfezia claveryi]